MFVVDSRNRSYFGGMDNVVASKGVRVVTEGSHSRGHCEGGRRITSFLHNIIIIIINNYFIFCAAVNIFVSDSGV